MGIISGIWLLLAGILFLGFGELFTKDLAPLLSSGGLSLLAAFLSFLFAGMEMLGGFLVYNFKYRLGGVLIVIASTVSVIAGAGFYISLLWGLGAGLIAFICPNLEKKIQESTTD
ncbi:MAG: hypothetical protein ACTSR3_18440 [Candidatus Helarchaeota archaeon]